MCRAAQLWYNVTMTFGSYKVVRELGKGGMSEVYEVENVRLGSRHALKLFTYSGDVAEVRDRFLAEGRLLAQLSHPRIVRVTDVGVDEASGRPYLVMDLIVRASGEPCTLADVPPGGADEREIARWYEDLREGLNFIHGKGVIHRDLKLQNVLIGPDGHAVITDFGISKITSKDLGEKVDPVQTIVRLRDGKNPLMGSLGYMAPELEMGQPASEASDWYSLGVLVFKLLTGVWYDAHMAVRETLETYDPVWLQILPKLLHANPQGRECLSWTELKEAADEEAVFKAENELAAARTQKRCVFRWACVMMAAMTVALTVLGVFGWRWRRDGRDASSRLEAAEAQLREECQSFEEKSREDRQAFEKTLEEANRKWKAKCEIPDFESVVRIPRDVPSGDNDKYELARIDAWVLTHGMFSDLKRGEISCDEAVQKLSDFARYAREGGLDKQFPTYLESKYSESDDDYDEDDYDENKDDEDEEVTVRKALVRLLSDAVTNLQERVQQ